MEIRNEGDVSVIVTPERLNGGAAKKLKASVETAAEKGDTRITIDCSDTAFI
ncbi:MAG: metal ABC transporter substrate-binding protein, partial [Chitinivibrionales bacterium]|nr:metal ABC transporter substrate-binding protein [Chitinivibrionales bacterium]